MICIKFGGPGTLGYGFERSRSRLGLVFMDSGWAGLSIFEPIPDTEAGPFSKSGHLSHMFFRRTPTGLGLALLLLRWPLVWIENAPPPPDRRETKLHASGYATESSDM